MKRLIYKIIVDGELFSKWGNNPIDFVPLKGQEIFYKSFRQNERWDRPIINYVLVVDKVSYETEEDWNSSYHNKVVNIHCTILKET